MTMNEVDYDQEEIEEAIMAMLPVGQEYLDAREAYDVVYIKHTELAGRYTAKNSQVSDDTFFASRDLLYAAYAVVEDAGDAEYERVGVELEAILVVMKSITVYPSYSASQMGMGF